MSGLVLVLVLSGGGSGTGTAFSVGGVHGGCDTRVGGGFGS